MLHNTGNPPIFNKRQTKQIANQENTSNDIIANPKQVDQVKMQWLSWVDCKEDKLNGQASA